MHKLIKMCTFNDMQEPNVFYIHSLSIWQYNSFRIDIVSVHEDFGIVHKCKYNFVTDLKILVIR